jgi:hypothetical protein
LEILEAERTALLAKTSGKSAERRKNAVTSMMRFKKRFFILGAAIIPILGLSFSAQAATYYVSEASGDDTNVGTSREAPLRTVAKAHEKAVVGDTVRVLKGIYDTRVYIRRSGAPGNPIVYEAEPGVVCVGFTVQASYVRIVGFEITRTVNDWADGAGIHVVGKYNEILSNYIHDVTRVGIQVHSSNADSPDVSNCIIRGNRIVKAGLAGIEILGRNHLVESNDISHTLQYPKTWTNPPSWADADGIHFFGSGHIIRKNRIYDITFADPENINPHIDCFQTYGPAYNIIFEQNYCNIQADGMQGYMVEEINAPVNDLVIRNSVIRAFRPLNIENCENTIIENNTFKSELTYTGGSAYGIELHASPNSKVINNLFYDIGRHSYRYLYIDSASTTGTQVDYNCHYISDGRPPAGSPRSHDLWQVDPKVVNASGNDFHLEANSALIDKGVLLTDVKADFDGVTRPQGSTHDIGAFEYTTYKRPPDPPTNLKVVQ